MRSIDVSCVTAANGWLCKVTVAEAGTETSHSVTLSRSDFQRLANGHGEARGGTGAGGKGGAGRASPEELVRVSFEFLLEREPKESILGSFELPEIGRYFPEYEREIGRRLSPR